MSYERERDILNFVNYCAKMSCIRWNSCKWNPRTKLGKFFKTRIIDKAYQFSRYCYRKKYWEMSQVVWESGERQTWIRVLKNAHTPFNTYPWPYVNPRFANWTEAPDTLVLDPSGFIIRHSMSYCAWKIFELTGKWPKVKTETHIEPKYFHYYLSLLGYNDVQLSLDFNHRYVGIDPRYGDNGEVFWYERKGIAGGAVVSTYRDRQYHYRLIEEEDIPFNIWVRID